MQPLDPRTGATTHFLLLYTLLKGIPECGEREEDKKEEKIGKPVRSRAREAPGLLLSAGPLGLLTFYASKMDKSGMSLFNKLADAFYSMGPDTTLEDARKKAGQLLGNNSDYNSLQKELCRGGKGYTILLSMITAFLDRQGLIQVQNGATSQDVQGRQQTNYIDKLIGFLNELASKPEQEAQVQDMLLPYLTHLKQLVEAVVKEDE